MSKLDRTTIGTWMSTGDKAMKPLTVRVSAEVYSKIQKIENKQDFLREAINKALSEVQ